MKKTFEIKEVNPRMLFLAWLLCYLDEHGETSEYFEKDHFKFDYLSICKFLNIYNDVDKYLFDFLQYEVIEEILFKKFEEIRKADLKIPEKKIENEIYQITNFKPKKIKKGYIWVKHYFQFKNSNRISHIGIKINKEKAKQYINEYIELWKNNDLFLPYENILKKENQIKIVVKKIFEIEKIHSYKNMLINMKYDIQENVDFVATIIFLKSIGDIEIKDFIQKYDDPIEEHGSSMQNLFFRITLKDKFFQDFTESKDKIHFDFEEICKQHKKRKIIYYDQPYKLTCEGKEHRINKGKLPFEIINRAFEDKKIVSVNIESLCKDIAMKESDFKKNIENFRAKLREKFGFKETENFFEVDNNEILLKGSIFQLKEKKV